jgi:hypothetical protein
MAAMRMVLTVLGLAALVTGCADGSSGETGSPAADPTGSATPASGTPAGSLDPALGGLVQPVIADAAARLAVEPSAVALVSIEAVTWNDGSLGCPKPGEMYTQALVDGHRIVVGAGGTTLDYRVIGPGAFRVCEHPATEP